MYSLRIVSTDRRRAVDGHCGLSFVADGHYSNLEQPIDTLLVIGSPASLGNCRPPPLRWLRQTALRGEPFLHGFASRPARIGGSLKRGGVFASGGDVATFRPYFAALTSCRPLPSCPQTTARNHRIARERDTRAPERSPRRRRRTVRPRPRTGEVVPAPLPATVHRGRRQSGRRTLRDTPESIATFSDT